MAGKLAEPGPSGDASEIELAAQAQTELDGERAAHRDAAAIPTDGPGDGHIGPVAIARDVKDDGRALIIYTRDVQAHA
jgi:hypothetical protein